MKSQNNANDIYFLWQSPDQHQWSGNRASLGEGGYQEKGAWLPRNMADGKEGKKLRWKKSEKNRRIRRQEQWKKEEKEIKELEARCSDVSCYYLC